MARAPTLVAAALALCLVLAPAGLAWYKHAAGSGFHSVGRAAGLLSGPRRAQYARRSEPPAAPPGRAGAFPELRPRLRSPAVCVTHVAPHLHSCERRPDGRATFRCKADVSLSLGAADCRRV